MHDESPASPAQPAVASPRLLWLLGSATFLIFFQAFMVAPLIPRLADLLDSTSAVVGLAVPAYLVPYGVTTLIWGPLSDRLGRGPVILVSLTAFVLLTAATATAHSAASFVAIRLVTALGASGVVPISLALIGDVIPFAQRGRALGFFFGAMAGGIAFGSSAGALLEPVLSWRGLFLVISVVAAVVLGGLIAMRHALPDSHSRTLPPARLVAVGYFRLLQDARARRTYGYVLLNAILHSGIYTWLGLYFERRYGLGAVGIGVALLGYGIPGFVLGPLIGQLADRRGRARLIPMGVAISAMCALALAADIPVGVAALAVAVLSLGYDLTQPLLAGIVTQLPAQRGQAMGFNVFTLFLGFGIGSLAFQVLLDASLGTALVIFGIFGLVAAVAATQLFRRETTST